MWFGRDAFGRRSLLVHWPNSEDFRFLLSSVSPISIVEQSSGIYSSQELSLFCPFICILYTVEKIIKRDKHKGISLTRSEFEMDFLLFLFHFPYHHQFLILVLVTFVS